MCQSFLLPLQDFSSLREFWPSPTGSRKKRSRPRKTRNSEREVREDVGRLPGDHQEKRVLGTGSEEGRGICPLSSRLFRHAGGLCQRKFRVWPAGREKGLSPASVCTAQQLGSAASGKSDPATTSE